MLVKSILFLFMTKPYFQNAFMGKLVSLVINNPNVFAVAFSLLFAGMAEASVPPPPGPIQGPLVA
jgi:hypothetical protein